MKKKKVILEKLDLILANQKEILKHMKPVAELMSQPDPPGTPPPEEDE